MLARKLVVAVPLVALLALSPAEAGHRRRGERDRFHHAARSGGLEGNGPVVLFDNAHAQTAGNADWTITGGFSDFADTLRHHQFRVKAHDSGEITAQVLTGVKVLVIPEPNRRLSAGELQAMTKFMEAGGGIFAIGDHEGADRDNDGWDSVRIFNEFTPAFGITFDPSKFTEAPMTGRVQGAELAEGVRAIGSWAGTSLTLTGKAKGHFNFRSPNKPYVASVEVGQGRLVAIGDSSPFDDGTGAPGNKLHDGYIVKEMDHAQLALNTVRWLAKLGHEQVDR